MTTARDIMTPDVTCVGEKETLADAARKMAELGVGSLPICGEDNRLKGMVTDRDIVVRALAEGQDARQVTAESVMTTDLYTVRPNDRVIEAIRKMGDKQVRRLPVVDREGNLRGIISMADIALETEADRELGEALEEISSGSSFWNRIFS
jgi:CBS domain-containing protein